MPTLPVQADLDQLRRQARELLRAARSGDATAAGRIHAVSGRLTLTAARLAIARGYGFASWARLKEEVQARSQDLAEQARAFCEASIRDWTGRAARMLAARPELAECGLAPAVILGDIVAVQAVLDRDPAAATRPDTGSGWTPLHLACASRWHRLDPARADGLTAVARLLLDSGAALTATTNNGATPLRCAVAGAANPAIVGLLLERGAEPDDHDLYLACFGGDGHHSLRLLLSRASPHVVAETTALSAPISTGDTEGVRLLLEAGADPNHLPQADLYGSRYTGGPPWPPVHAAIQFSCPPGLIELLLAAGADPDAPGPDGRTPHQLAARQGRADVARMIRRYGGQPSASSIDLFLSACLNADRAAAERYLQRIDAGQLGPDEHAALFQAAEVGNAAAVEMMLDLGFPVSARGDDGGTALHAAGYNGSREAAQLLLGRGADPATRDTTWNDTPLGWAIVGSGERPNRNPGPDWVATVQALVDAGAPLDGITLSPDDPKSPSPEVAQLLRAHGVPDEHTGK